MSAAYELLARLAEIGAAIEPNGDQLILRAGRKPIPGELVGQLRRAKDEVFATLASIEQAAQHASDHGDDLDIRNAKWWRRQFTIRTIHWEIGGDRASSKAQGLAYNDLMAEWVKLHGQLRPDWQCAGCDAPIGGLPALPLADGNRVHFDDELRCLARFGRCRHDEAVAGLRALGLDPPEGFTLL
jgi:hypothetical protein